MYIHGHRLTTEPKERISKLFPETMSARGDGYARGNEASTSSSGKPYNNTESSAREPRLRPGAHQTKAHVKNPTATPPNELGIHREWWWKCVPWTRNFAAFQLRIIHSLDSQPWGTAFKHCSGDRIPSGRALFITLSLVVTCVQGAAREEYLFVQGDEEGAWRES